MKNRLRGAGYGRVKPKPASLGPTLLELQQTSFSPRHKRGELPKTVEVKSQVEADVDGGPSNGDVGDDDSFMAAFDLAR